MAWYISLISLTKVVSPQYGGGSVIAQPSGRVKIHSIVFIALLSLLLRAQPNWSVS